MRLCSWFWTALPISTFMYLISMKNQNHIQLAAIICVVMLGLLCFCSMFYSQLCIVTSWIHFSFSWIGWISCNICVVRAVVNLGSCNGGHDNHTLWMYYEYMLHCCKYIVNFKIYIINMFWSFSFGDYRWQTFKTKSFNPLALPRHINVLFWSPLKAFSVI